MLRGDSAEQWGQLLDASVLLGAQRHEESTRDQPGPGGFVDEDHCSRRQIYQVVPGRMNV